jgi:hypothetical protein
MSTFIRVGAFVLGVAGGMCLAGFFPASIIPQRFRLPAGAFLVGVGMALALGI